jgi:hypothetical protein
MPNEILKNDPILAKLEQSRTELRETSTKNQTPNQQAQTIATPANTTVWTATNAMTICSVFLVFSLVIICLATYLLKIGKSTDSVLKIFGTILIITIACFLILAGYDDKQIAPVIGLLGTLAGYLLGKDREATRSSQGDQQRTAKI